MIIIMISVVQIVMMIMIMSMIVLMMTLCFICFVIVISSNIILKHHFMYDVDFSICMLSYK